MKIIVAGSRTITNRAFILSAMEKLISNGFTVISGCAQGVDKIAAEIAREHGLEVIEMPADWKKHGKRAGFIRNEEMAEIADGLLAIWDGMSSGTHHMINTMHEMGKRFRIVLTSQDTRRSR